METSLPTTLRTGLSGHPTRGKSLPAISRCKTMETSSSTAQRGRLCGHRILRGRCHIGHHLPLLHHLSLLHHLPLPLPPARHRKRYGSGKPKRKRGPAKSRGERREAEVIKRAENRAADQPLIHPSRKPANPKKKIAAKAALDKLAATEREK